MLGSLMLGSSGATLLWWKRPAPHVRPRARRHELPITLPPEPEVTDSLSATPVLRDAVPTSSLVTLMPEPTTRIVAFAGTQRRVRLTARA